MQAAKKSGIRLLVGAGVLVAAVAASAQKVSTDFNHDANFSQYHTFSIHKIQSSDPLFEGRIQSEITRELQSKGLRQVPNGGDLAVTAIGNVKDQQEYNSFYTGLGGGGFGWGGGGWGGRGFGRGGGFGGGGLGDSGETTTSVVNVPVGTLMVDLYDTGTHQLVWRGQSQQQVSSKPEKNIGKVNKTIDKMFDKYPTTR